MAIRFNVRLKRDGVEIFRNRVLNIPRAREGFVDRASEQILADAILNAPHDTNELRESGEIRKTTRSAKTTTNAITFERTAPWGDGIFDVAKWTHDPEEFTRSTYTPSDPDPRVGPKYLQRAYHDHADNYRVEFVRSVRGVAR